MTKKLLVLLALLNGLALQATPPLRVISYNVNKFEGYDAPSTETAASIGTAIGEAMLAQKPDILSLQDTSLVTQTTPAQLDMIGTGLQNLIAAMGSDYTLRLIRGPGATNQGAVIYRNSLPLTGTISVDDDVGSNGNVAGEATLNHWARLVFPFTGENVIVYAMKLQPQGSSAGTIATNNTLRLAQIDLMGPQVSADLTAGASVILLGDLNHEYTDVSPYLGTTCYNRWLNLGDADDRLVDTWRVTSGGLGGGQTKVDDVEPIIGIPAADRRIDYVWAANGIADRLRIAQPLNTGRFVITATSGINSWALSNHIPHLAVFHGRGTYLLECRESRPEGTFLDGNDTISGVTQQIGVSTRGTPSANRLRWALSGAGGNSHRLRNIDRNLYLDYETSPTTDGDVALFVLNTSNAEQSWEFVPTDSGYYYLKNVSATRYLDSDTGGLVDVNDANTQPDTQWRLVLP